VLLHLVELLKFVHYFLEVATALPRCASAEKCRQRLENSGGPSWARTYLRRSLEAKMAEWKSMNRTYLMFSSSVHLPSTDPTGSGSTLR
jgi:hypothetical protein